MRHKNTNIQQLSHTNTAQWCPNEPPVLHIYIVAFSLLPTEQTSSEDDQLSSAFSPGTIPSTSIPVADLLPGGGSPLKTVANGADNDVDIVGIFGNGQDTVFSDMPGGIYILIIFNISDLFEQLHCGKGENHLLEMVLCCMMPHSPRSVM